MTSVRKSYPEIHEKFTSYELEKGDEELIDLEHKLSSYFIDLHFMVIYWKQLLDYLGYDSTYMKMFREIYNSRYDIEEDVKQPMKERERRIEEVNNLVKKSIRWYQIKHFWDK